MNKKPQVNPHTQIDQDGWDTYNGRNHQWYSLYYDPNSGFVKLDADNSGDCYGNYNTLYFANPKSFANYCNQIDADWTTLLGDIDEDNLTVITFVDAIMGC